MRILSREEFRVKTIETKVKFGPKVYVVKDFFDETDKIIDTKVTLNGCEVEEPAEYEAILDFIDSIY